MTESGTRNPWRSTGAVFAGLLFIFITHNGTDAIMHATGVFPPYDVKMTDNNLFALAFSYRLVFAIAGCFVTAWLAPRNPMFHALVLGGIGTVLSAAGAFAMWDYGPHWYPLALVVISLPSAWAGGKLYAMKSAV